MGKTKNLFECKDNVLYFDGCSVKELAQQFGTPLYIYSETAIEKQFSELREAFLNRYENTRAAYACKAFCSMAMLKLVERAGMCIDVVSGGELHTAIQAEFPPERIEFNGNNKLPEEIQMAVDYGIGRIIIDGLQELALIEKVCKEKGKTIKVLYRITPGVNSSTHEYITTGKKDSKFGIPLDEEIIYSAVEAAIRSPYVEFLGFHFHVGSQLHDNTSHLKALETSLELSRQTKLRFGYDVRELNLGGGFGIRYLPGEERKSYDYFLEPAMKRIEEVFGQLGIPRPAVVIEPGRSIVGEAGISLSTVGSIKEIPDTRIYVSVDGGMSDNIRPALYQADYEGIVATRAEEKKDALITVCGKCCESGDILIKDLSAAMPKSGDLLAIFSTGAYGYSMANNYNHNPIPAAVLVREGAAEVIVKRQSYQQLTANDVIPESLR